MKTKIKKLIAQILITSTFFFGLIFVCERTLIAMTAFWTDFLVMHTDSWTIKVPVASAEEELPMREWIKQEVEKAGLNWKEAEKIIDCESKFNPDAHAINWNNKAGIDRGLWMINSLYHKEVSNADAYDYKKSTQHAIRIYKDRGNWSAWACSRIVGLK